ncbi:MAG: NYN domain-containing protein [Thermoanaerobaculia bacterium]|nr:NYN domain-containing protein [Thermoanaerobaculia bacterium]
MPLSKSSSKVGVYADVANMYRTGGQRLQYDRLRKFACRDHAEPLRLNAYVTFDVERAARDRAYRQGAVSFHNKLRDYGYKVIVKEIRWFQDQAGNRFGKTDAALDLAVDVLLQSENLDRVLLASGDGDLVNVVRALQNRGCRVEVVGLDDTAWQLREEADLFISGYQIPDMVPMRRTGPERISWGDIGSRVRGWCYWFEEDRGFGYMRFLKHIAPGLWFTDARHPDSPWETAFVRAANMPPHVRTDRLPTRNYVFEFELTRSERGDGLQALNVELVSSMADRPSASTGLEDQTRNPRHRNDEDYDDYDESEEFDDEYDVEEDAEYDDYDEEA